MEYKFNEKGKIEEEFTPARRSSFLVGKNENSHTAQSRLLPLLLDDEANPTLHDLEDAFSVERVTKEFFEKYRDLFLRLKEALDEVVKKNPEVKADFESKGVSIVDFAKKLLGQIVFLYFLQKKGWFGVKRGEEWGSGSKRFLRELFEKKHLSACGNAQAGYGYKNFFNDILEPLFYEALRLERPGDYYRRFDCRIPFLNGGLFDPINDYDWKNTDILLPDDMFSNDHKTKEGDTGNGILDIFDRYNFTVKEDEPLEKEVAIDPEMLGQVFENLLTVKDRKSKGTYYTPREIVHYMCQESLANYLATELAGKVSKEDIETLIKCGEQVGENEAMVETKGRETETYFYKLPESVRQNAKLIDEKLANIKVCDPAIGSGAFPVGMMGEITKARKVLSAFIKEPNRTIYHFKRECIEKSLYGVDIDPGAVEIAKLRLWLSLVVDEEDYHTIKPLPNLDYKIVCGNSLLGVEENLFNQQLFEKLERLKPLLFNETSPSKKQEYKKQIDDLILQITKGHKEFDFEVYFSEVFHEKKGFDVVIANPPYVRQEEIKEYKPLLQKARYKVYNSTSDLYTYFYELSYNILAPSRFSCFISSNKWMRAKYGEKLRNFFKTKTKVINLVDFGGHKVFETATVDTNILLFQKAKPQPEYAATYINIENNFTGENLDEYVHKKQQTIKQNELSDSGWTLADDKVLALKKKIEKIGTPLKDWDVKINRGIVTGFNEAFIIDTATKERLCAEDPESTEIIKPILRGRDISRYYYKWAGLWVIATFPSIRFDINNYPAIRDYLRTFGRRLDQSGFPGCRKKTDHKWFEIQDNTAYYPEFEKEKIVWAETAQEMKMAYVHRGFYLLKTCFLITGEKLKFIQSVSNSVLLDWYIKKSVHKLGAKGIYLSGYFVEQLPIPQIPETDQKPFIDLVDKIMAITKEDDYLTNSTKQLQVKEYERQIDQLVYQLYDLTPEEINIVEKQAK